MNSIFNKLAQALTNTSNKISQGIDHIFIKKKLNEESLHELEELLITSDISITVVNEIIDHLKKLKFNKEISIEEIKETLSTIISDIFKAVDKPFTLNNNTLNIILVCGVNGNGKTTTIGKLAGKFINEGKKVAIAACDTFRAAAVEQLMHWANNVGAIIFSSAAGTDPASVAYNAILKSQEQKVDILLIDTAGRLHNHKNLMEELGKIIRVIKKIDDTAPHYSLLVIEATTGQNVHNQVEQFNQTVVINGLIITKLDGTARAGALVGIVKKFLIPIYFIGIGEKLEDIRIFDYQSFTRLLVGLPK